MAEILPAELIEAIQDAETLKSIGTVDKNGVPHIVYKGSLHLNEKNQFVFYDLLENSKVNENLVYAIWFQKKVVIHILTKERKSYEIVCHPEQSVTSGREFEAVYNRIVEKDSENDLNAIWTIVPESVREETYTVRRAKAREEYSFLQHIDKFI